MIFIQLLVGYLDNFTYIIGDENTSLAVVVDPAGEVKRIQEEVKKYNLNIIYIINTHSHFDHTLGNRELASKTGAKIIMHENSSSKKDIIIKDNDTIEVGELKIKVIHTPGHTPDSVCLLLEKKLLTGDTLFVGSCGRADFQGSNPKELYRSLQKLANLDGDIEVYPGHNYGENPFSTIEYERENNYTLKFRNEGEFLRFMSKD